VQEYLQRFGYTSSGVHPTGVLDDPTAEALARFQTFHGLQPTGVFDDATRAAMTTPRCAMADMRSGVAFGTTCKWSKTDLTYAFDTGTNDIAGSGEFDAVRNAFATWAASTPLTFTEVATTASPDVRIGWRPASDPDLSMVGGTLAHADFPPGCSVVTNSLPKPVHFDDSEHVWSIGAVAGAFDVETVALHEIGHILGMAHSAVPGAVMFPTVSPNFRLVALTADDVTGIQSLYGGSAPAPAPPFPGRLLRFPPVLSGADVITWQRRMSQRGFTLSVDGLYGQQSKTACTTFQTQQGLKADGIVGQMTWAATFAAV
jgi:hypothetical protein